MQKQQFPRQKSLRSLNSQVDEDQIQSQVEFSKGPITSDKSYFKRNFNPFHNEADIEEKDSESQESSNHESQQYSKKGRMFEE